MKLYYLIIIFSLIINIKNTDFCDDRIVATGPKDCENLITSTRSNFCCYFEGKYMGVEKKSCIDISNVRKKNINDYIKTLNNDENFDFDIKKIECDSFLLQIKFFSFLLLILL